LHPSGEAQNWLENTANYCPLVTSYFGEVVGIDILDQNCNMSNEKPEMLNEGDDLDIPWAQATEQDGKQIEQWFLLHGFVSEFALVRINASLPGPSRLGSFCSTYVGGSAARPITGPKQPRGATKLLGTNKSARCYASLLAAKCGAAVCLQPSGGIYIALAQVLCLPIRDDITIPVRVLEHFENPSIDLAGIRAGWRVLKTITHAEHDWFFDAAAWWHACTATEAEEICRKAYRCVTRKRTDAHKDVQNWWDEFWHLLERAKLNELLNAPQ
jgi:hypothetical protein